MLEDFKLRVFLTAARTGSFTEAAKEAGISQPAVSQNITALEKQLCVRLFDRKRGEVFLTEDGRAFREYAQKILYWYEAADNMFGNNGKLTLNRPVRIAADDIAADYILPEALTTLRAADPQINFRIEKIKKDEARPDSIFDIEASAGGTEHGTHFGTPVDADVELTMIPSPDTMDFEGESKLVGVMEAAVVASPLNRSLAAAAVGEDGEAAQKPFSTIAGIHVSNGIAVWSGYMDFLSPDLLARVCVESSSAEAIKTMVASSSSLVGVLPECCVKEEIKEGKLLRMPVQLPEFTFDIHFNPLPEFAGRKVCRLLLSTLTESLRQTRARTAK